MRTALSSAPNSGIASSPRAPHLKTAVILPAYNEAGRITNVLKTVSAARLVDEIIVVTDGCSDSTADEARGFAALLDKGRVKGAHCQSMQVLELEQNLGKGGAMTYGAHRTEADVVLFLDADLMRLKPSQVDAMLEPTLRANPEERADMTLGLFQGAPGGPFGWWMNWCHRTAAALTGQRAIRRDVYLAVPELTRSGFGVETAITRYVKYAWKLRVESVNLIGVTHPCKEEKVGVMRGLIHRSQMYSDIALYAVVDTLRQNTSLERRRQMLQRRNQFSNRG
ncbi:MAG TPA: glycosyltransferase family 2 protein [Abditibacteriaceae bacterium]